jgi:GNAT superfamily N-acetyltransferase
MQVTVREATQADCDVVSSILLEAAAWLQARGTPMWRDSELLTERIRGDVGAGLFFLALCAGEPAGTIKFQLSDPLFWPDVPDDAAYVHRLAVRRRFAGGTISFALLTWAIARAAALGRRFLRLDCEASRSRLRAVYERFGFRHHSDRQVGPYFVALYEYSIPPQFCQPGAARQS